MFVCCVLSGRGLCDELITHPEESYRLRCVIVCDLETPWIRRPWPTGGLLRQKQTNKQIKLMMTTSKHVARVNVASFVYSVPKKTVNRAGCQISNLWTAWCFLDYSAITNRIPYERKGYTFLQVNTYLRLHSYSVQQTKLQSIARFGSLLDKTTVYREESGRRGLMTSR